MCGRICTVSSTRVRFSLFLYERNVTLRSRRRKSTNWSAPTSTLSLNCPLATYQPRISQWSECWSPLRATDYLSSVSGLLHELALDIAGGQSQSGTCQAGPVQVRKYHLENTKYCCIWHPVFCLWDDNIITDILEAEDNTGGDVLLECTYSTLYICAPVSYTHLTLPTKA